MIFHSRKPHYGQQAALRQPREQRFSLLIAAEEEV
jgi:hypothetical protein